MSLTLYYHPLASFCHKVLIALYENETPFEAVLVDLANPESSAPLLAHWPIGKIPVLLDKGRGQSVPETSIIIEYLTQHHPGRVELLPNDAERARAVRLWDRFFDLYMLAPIQKIVVDRLRQPGRSDPQGVEEATATLKVAYGMLDKQLQNAWATGDVFTMADCAAAPALFYAQTIVPFGVHRNIVAYWERLSQRPSVVRVIDESRPYLRLYPLYDQLDARYRD